MRKPRVELGGRALRFVVATEPGQGLDAQGLALLDQRPVAEPADVLRDDRQRAPRNRRA